MPFLILERAVSELTDKKPRILLSEILQVNSSFLYKSKNIANNIIKP